MKAAYLDPRITDLLRSQSGVIARRQLREQDVAEHVIQRWLRRRELVRVVPGVYVAHTGPLTPLQRAWVGVLAAWPAALGGHTALQVGLGRQPSGNIEIAVAHGRRLRAPPGVVLVRRSRLDDEVAWHLSPPRVRVEHAAIDVASKLGESYAAVETLAEACRKRVTTPDRLLAALAARPWVRDRGFLRDLLYDVRDGATSVLERCYLQLERAHGLPQPTRQRPERLGDVLVVRDVDYDEFGLVIELDGQSFHQGARGQDDLERDALVALDHRVTLRLGWRQVVDRGCATAAQVAKLLTARGWRGQPRPCSPECAVAPTA